MPTGRSRRCTFRPVTAPESIFWSPHYLRHNQRRQEHLASLGLDLAGRTVLELGAGLGDHTSFFLDRSCEVIITEPRPENLRILRERHPGSEVRQLDLEAPTTPVQVEIVYCYGVLYHLSDPAAALAWIAACQPDLVLLETCVSAQEELVVFPFAESAELPDNATSGHGCRPTRPWLLRELARHFPYAYVTTTQPWHEEFPTDWSEPQLFDRPLVRAVFVASARPLDLPTLSERVPLRQSRH